MAPLWHHDRVPPIYHITHRENLAAILGRGELLSDNAVGRADAAPVVIGHSHIKVARGVKPVPCGPGCCVGDYVPFYFCRRSPMLYVISCGSVEGYSGGQSEVVYLVSSTESVMSAKLSFVFTDGNAAGSLSKFYDDLVHLDKVDWPLMESRYWNNTLEDPSRRHRRQAEFLVLGRFACSLVTEIAVRTHGARAAVQPLVEAAGLSVGINVRPDWYY